MAILWMDGFDYYSASVPYSTRYTQINSGAYGGTGRFGGSYLRGGWRVQHPLDTARNTVSCGFGYRPAGAYTFSILGLQDNTPATQCSLFINGSGDLVFVRGTSISSNILGTASGIMSLGVWTYIEVEFTRHASAGAVNVYANGVLVISALAVNTGSADISFITIGTQDGTSPAGIDDYYCVSGATKLGERRVVALRPTADTAQKDWTPSSGSNNYSRISEASMDGDTSYVAASVVGDEDLYDLTDLGYTPAAIDAVQVICAARKDDANVRTIAPIIVSGATTDVADDMALSASYTIEKKLYETDPNTSALWTGAAVDALQAGIKVTA